MELFVSRFPVLGSSHPSTLAITIKERKREREGGRVQTRRNIFRFHRVVDFTFISKLVFRFPVALETSQRSSSAPRLFNNLRESGGGNVPILNTLDEEGSNYIRFERGLRSKAIASRKFNDDTANWQLHRLIT